MEKLKLAVLGVGDVAQRDYLPEFHRIADRAKLVAACGRTEDRVRSVAEEYGIAARYTDYERMLDETDADAVLNLTPMQLHTETTLAALEAGKHVYSEKPVASTTNAAERILKEAHRRRLTIVCAPSVMLFPQIRYARKLLGEDAIGPVYSARGHGYGGVPPWSGFTSDPSQFFSLGGGPAVDMGVYPLHALTGLLGPARKVSALTAKAQESFTVPDGPARSKVVPIEVDDNWHLLLDLGGSRLAAVEANNVVEDTRSPQLELFGLHGTIAVNLLDVSAPVEVLGSEGRWERVELPRTGRQAGPDHLLGVEHLLDCVTNGQEPVLSVEHAMHVVEIIEKAARSSTEGRTMDVESTFTGTA